VQSSIAFTSAAGDSVAAAICSASASSILGVFLSALLVGAPMHTQCGDTDMLQAIGAIMLQLIVPFVVRHLMRPLIGKWVDRHRKLINITDRSSILLVVVMMINTYAERWLGFDTVDEITIVLCGSKKSLANGIPMANVLFPAATVGSWCYR